jgi:hypothetical protein
MTVTLDNGEKVTVDICDEHAEDATVKTVRVAHQTKLNQISALIEQAKALGMDISVNQSGLSVAQKTPEPAPQPSPASQMTPQEIEKPIQPDPVQELSADEEDEDIVSTDLVDKLASRGIQSVGGSTSMGSVDSHSSLDMNSMSEKLPEEARKGKAKMGIAEGRGGQPLVIPKKRVDGTGTTRINIRNKENDVTLQDRFKKMANDSMQDNAPDFARSGYQNSTRDCPFCRGDGEVQGQECPKCKGDGFISVY